MKQKSRVLAAAFVVPTLILSSVSAFALGFGRPTSQAVLGEPLTLSVPVRIEASEELTDECVSAEVHFGDVRVSDSAVNLSLQGRSATERTLRVTTTRLVNEPIVSVTVKAGCVASMTRQFVVLADPPMAAAPAAVALTAQDKAPATAGLAGQAATKVSKAPKAPVVVDAVETARPVPQPTPRRSDAVRAVASGVTITPMSLRAGASTPSDQAAPASRAARTAPKPEAQPRLMLDPAGIDASISPDLRMSGGLEGAASAEGSTAEVMAKRQAAAALWRAMNAEPEQVVREQQRVQELEQRLAQLNTDSAKAHEAVGSMQARLQELESGGSRSVWTYVLALIALAGVLAAAFFYLQLRKSRTGRDAAWWQSQIDEAASEAASESASELGGHTSADFVRRTEPVSELRPEAKAPSDAVPDSSVPADSVVPAAHTGVTTASVAAAAMPAADVSPFVDSVPAPLMGEISRAVTVEELIDLEQQADFFVVLGQDDAAIELLENHIAATASASPLPYLKLLEIYQHLGRRADYERVQQSFNQRFNAYAPSWESDLQQGHTLDDYPGVVERLQSLWSAPVRAMDVLERSLTRPDDEAETFDLPAYRELLFLYAVARDLAERERQQVPVDLLLPESGDDQVQPADAPEAAEPLMATRPIKAQPEARPDFTLDLDLAELEPSSVGSQPFTTRPLSSGVGAADHQHIDLPDVSGGAHKP